MNTKILVRLLCTFVLASCSKNTYNTKPTLKISSVNTTVVPINGTLTFDLQVTDKEGDVTNTLYVRKVRLNKKIPARTLRDSFALKIPDAPNSKDGTVQLSMTYQNYLISAETPIENDTLAFKFAIKDKANNVSDTVTSEPIVIIRL